MVGKTPGRSLLRANRVTKVTSRIKGSSLNARGVGSNPTRENKDRLRAERCVMLNGRIGA